METRYILPATVAATLHLIAFFGFKPSAHPPVLAADPAAGGCTLTPVPFTITEPPEPVDQTEAVAPQPKGSPDALRPETEEPPPRAEGLTMPWRPASPQPMDIKMGIPPGVPGVPDGIADGTGKAPVWNLAGLDNQPRAKVRISPGYPGELRTAGITGEVLVAFVVDETGRVAQAWVVRSSDSRFEAATLQAVQRWRFEPGKKNGRAVRFRMEVPVSFSIAE